MTQDTTAHNPAVKMPEMTPLPDGTAPDSPGVAARIERQSAENAPPDLLARHSSNMQLHIPNVLLTVTNVLAPHHPLHS
jgi:hypothetical protein